MNDKTKNQYAVEMVEIKKKIKESPGLTTYVLDKDMNFRPGEFILVSVLGIGESALSFSSFPDVQITVDEVGNVTRALSKLKPGDKVGIRGPYGNSYPIEHLKGKNVYLISGGCGLAPMRSLIKYYEENLAELRSLSLFFGDRNPQAIPFKKDITRWKKKFNVYLSVDKGGPGWKGNVGFVTELIEKHEFQKGSIAVFCGPPVMFKHTAEILNKKGFSDDDLIVSLERRMECGIGKCLHCSIGGKLVCEEGPVFRWSEVKGLE
jgi:NAD(P)H-flavin reductase